MWRRGRHSVGRAKTLPPSRPKGPSMSSDEACRRRADQSLSRLLEPLPAGSWVRVTCARDAWLQRYSGMRCQVERDDGLIVDVLLPGGSLMSFWRNEVHVLVSRPTLRSGRGPQSEERQDRQLEVPGRSLQRQRRRAGVTQAAIATVMGVSVPRISQIEAAPAVRSVTAARYLEALRMASLSAA
jgi:DNA-binding XRE family transcriptional regulator